MTKVHPGAGYVFSTPMDNSPHLVYVFASVVYVMSPSRVDTPPSVSGSVSQSVTLSVRRWDRTDETERRSLL